MMISPRKWLCKIKKRGILEFEYKDLPEDLKDRSLFHRAMVEKLISSIRKKGNGRNTWRISDNIKCRDEDYN